MKQLGLLCAGIYLLISAACVGPEEYHDGLLENLPAVNNTNEIFTLNLKANKYTFSETYDLKLVYIDSVDVLTLALNITGYSGNDTAVIELIDQSNDSSIPIKIFSNGIDNISFYAATIAPTAVNFYGDNFSGNIDFSLLKSTDSHGPFYGIDQNFPVTIQGNSNFSYILDAHEFTFDHTYSSSIDTTDTNSVLYTSLFISSYIREGGAGLIEIFAANDSLIRQFPIADDVVLFYEDSIRYFRPADIRISGNNLTAAVEFIMSK